MLPPGAIFQLKIHQNAYAAGAPDLTGEAYRAPRLPSWFSGSRFAAEEGEMGEGREKGRA